MSLTRPVIYSSLSNSKNSKVNNLVIKILTAVIVLVDLYKCIIKEYYSSNAHLDFHRLFKNNLLLFNTSKHLYFHLD